MLKTVVLLHIFVETVTHLVFQDTLNRKFKTTAFIYIFCNITVILIHFNAPLLLDVLITYF